jgi:protein phosphatase
MLWNFRFWNRRSKAPAVEPPPEPVSGLLSDVGCQRPRNEDAARIVRAGVGRHGDRGLLVLVADGMGGHEAGEVASQAAVELIEKEYRRSKGTPGEALAGAFRVANRRILELAAANASMGGMGTTCTALAIVGWKAWAAHVGDSRLYLVRGAGIYQLSEDHTQCMQLVRKGILSLEEARRREDRNVLVHALGTRSELVLMTWPAPMTVKAGDWFVLCSDGLHELVNREEIRAAVKDGAPQYACNRLVQMARDRGGYDNITIAIAAIPGALDVPASVKVTRECEAKV